MRAAALVLVSTSVMLLSSVAGCDPDVTTLREEPITEVSTSPRDAGADGEGDGEGGAPARVTFRRDIRPIIERSDGPPAGCRRCHYRALSTAQGFELGGLDLTTLGTLRRGGISSGRTIVVPGNPDASVIVQKLEGTYARGERMPKGLTPLSRGEIDLVRRWIAEGAEGADDE